jgi:hypothetical protein
MCSFLTVDLSQGKKGPWSKAFPTVDIFCASKNLKLCQQKDKLCNNLKSKKKVVIVTIDEQHCKLSVESIFDATNSTISLRTP